MADKHKRLSGYSVVTDGKVSKLVEFSRGEAEVFVRNFIECRLAHAGVKATKALDNIKAYFTDTDFIKQELETSIDKLIAGIINKLTGSQDSGGEEGTGEQLTREQEQALENAKTRLATAKQDVSNVEDDSDFNKESIDDAKNIVSDTLEDLQKKGITNLTISDGEESDESLDLKTVEREINNDLNKLRKWQFDLFEEEFMAELYIGAYHEYKYAKTINELCEAVSDALLSLGVKITFDPELYEVSGIEVVHSDEPERNIEEDIKDALDAAGIEYKRINIDWHDKNFDFDNEDSFKYGE